MPYKHRQATAAHYQELVAWEDESKLLMASSHQLPITVFGMDKGSAQRLILIWSFLLYLREDLVPVPYVDFNQQIFTQIVRRMSSYSASIRTDSEAVIADYFKTCLPRSTLPNFHVHHWAGLIMTTIVWYTLNEYFLSDDPYHLAQEGCNVQTDGQKSPNDYSNPSAYVLQRGLIKMLPTNSPPPPYSMSLNRVMVQHCAIENHLLIVFYVPTEPLKNKSY